MAQSKFFNTGRLFEGNNILWLSILSVLTFLVAGAMITGAGLQYNSCYAFSAASGYNGLLSDEDADDVDEISEMDGLAAEDEAGFSVTEHSVTINGKIINYSATAGTLTLAAEDGKEKAHVFFIAYTKNDGGGDGNSDGDDGGLVDSGKRPITFAFNGGPGSSSVWLHLGAFGPQRVLMGDDEGMAPAPPYELVENEYSLLDITDIVFIDPVTTGYSRAVPGENPDQFHGVREDVQSVGEFIRLYTTRFGRWESPKFLAGESYGTTRAAGLSGYLQDNCGMYLNGIILVSSILNFQTASFDRGNDLAYITFLPSYAATAWYHDALSGNNKPRDIKKFLEEVREFAGGEYTLALMKGDELSDSEREKVISKVAKYTGLSAEFVADCNLRISMGRFAKELLRNSRGQVTGRLDSRFLGIDYDNSGSSYDYDASYAAIQGPFTAMMNHYVRSELGYKSDLPYEILTGRVHPWSYDQYRNRYVNVGETLRSAMTQNQNLQVFVANGYYDLATPFFATEYTFSHLGLDKSLRDNVSFAYYESGHMMYIRKECLAKLKDDISEFFVRVLGGGDR